VSVHTCPYCGSQRLVRDHATGALVCADCGSVVEEYFDDSRVFAWDARQTKRRRPRYVVRYTGPRGPEGWLGRVYLRKGRWLKLVSYTTSKAHTILEQRSDVYEALIEALGEDFVKSRRARTIASLVVYVEARAEGMSKRAALALARRETGANTKHLEALLREYRDRVEEAIQRVREKWREGKATLPG